MVVDRQQHGFCLEGWRFVAGSAQSQRSCSPTCWPWIILQKNRLLREQTHRHREVISVITVMVSKTVNIRSASFCQDFKSSRFADSETPAANWKTKCGDELNRCLTIKQTIHHKAKYSDRSCSQLLLWPSRTLVVTNAGTNVLLCLDENCTANIQQKLIFKHRLKSAW